MSANIESNLLYLKLVYFFTIPNNNNIQPAINNSPPIGVNIPIPVGTTLFITRNEAIRYKEPEKNTIPATKKIPA